MVVVYDSHAVVSGSSRKYLDRVDPNDIEKGNTRDTMVLKNIHKYVEWWRELKLAIELRQKQLSLFEEADRRGKPIDGQTLDPIEPGQCSALPSRGNDDQEAFEE